MPYAVAVAACNAPVLAQERREATVAPVPASALIARLDIPYRQFTLANGLRVIVHTDRKAPVVAVSLWYDVGSKHEPPGRSGFAHLFEHLMFNGSANAPGDFFEPMKRIGATSVNGTTSADATNFFETVPTASLERALFLESDRMAHLTGPVSQAVLDEQRGVVQNEKRLADNQPYGLAGYMVTAGLYPRGHPYGHETIGSMADLDAATLDTASEWFHAHYGPNNAVLALAGDIDMATARRLVDRYFGSIPAGPRSRWPDAPVPTLAAPVAVVMHDRVTATMMTRSWAVPGLNDDASAGLEVAATVLGGLAASRLDRILVRDERLAVQVSANCVTYAQAGTFGISVMPRDGGDPAVVARRLDAIVADFIRTGPTVDEVARSATRTTVWWLQALESVGGLYGKAGVLAGGALRANDPGFYRRHLQQLAAQTPATVAAAMRTWLGRPSYSLTIVPGTRAAYEEASAPAAAMVPARIAVSPGPAIPAPPLDKAVDPRFPMVVRTRLRNGIELVHARRDAVAMTRLALSFDAGFAAEADGRPGTQALTLALLQEGTPRFPGAALAAELERLGAQFDTAVTNDRTVLKLNLPSANLAHGLDLYADLARDPAFTDEGLSRMKTQQVAKIGQELNSPDKLAARVLPSLLDTASPYARARGQGDARTVAALTRADVSAFRHAWLRPDKARIFVVSDLPVDAIKAALDARFGDWRESAAAGKKDFSPAPRPAPPGIVLIDRPGSSQSFIYAGQPTALPGMSDLLPVVTANEALGGDFLGRLNMDLREGRHWSYGVSGTFRQSAFAVPYVVAAAVQSDRTGAAIAALRDDIATFVTTRPMSEEEFDRAIAGSIRSLPGRFETSESVLSAMQANDLFRRGDDYLATIAARYRAMTLPSLRRSIRQVLDPARMIWVVVGAADRVAPQLAELGLPVRTISPDSATEIEALRR